MESNQLESNLKDLMNNFPIFYVSFPKMFTADGLIWRKPFLEVRKGKLTLSLARRSCLTTTISAKRRTLVMAPRRQRAARTKVLLSGSISSSRSSQMCSIAPPEKKI